MSSTLLLILLAAVSSVRLEPSNNVEDEELFNKFEDEVGERLLADDNDLDSDSIKQIFGDFEGDVKHESGENRAASRVYNYWPGGVVPIRLGQEFYPELRDALAKFANKHFEKACVRFTIAEPFQRHFVYISGTPGVFNWTNPTEAGCMAEKGMTTQSESTWITRVTWPLPSTGVCWKPQAVRVLFNLILGFNPGATIKDINDVYCPESSKYIAKSQWPSNCDGSDCASSSCQYKDLSPECWRWKEFCFLSNWVPSMKGACSATCMCPCDQVYKDKYPADNQCPTTKGICQTTSVQAYHHCQKSCFCDNTCELKYRNLDRTCSQMKTQCGRCYGFGLECGKCEDQSCASCLNWKKECGPLTKEQAEKWGHQCNCEKGAMKRFCPATCQCNPTVEINN